MSGVKKNFIVRETLEVSNNITSTGNLQVVSVIAPGNSTLNVATISTANIGNLTFANATTNALTTNTANITSATIRALSSNVITSNTSSSNVLNANTANVVTVNVSNTLTSNALVSSNVVINNLTVENLTVTGNSSLAFERGSTLRSYREFVETANVSGSYILDLNNSNVFRINLSANTSLSLNNTPVNSLTTPVTLIVNRTAPNARIVFPANTVWSESIQPTQSTGIGQRDIFTLLIIDSGDLIVGSHSFANVG